jgi:hypothetical protein
LYASREHDASDPDVVNDPSPMNYAALEVWHTDMIVRAMGLSAPWTGKQFADMYEAVTAAYDATRLAASMPLSVEDMKARRAVMVSHLRRGESVLDLPTITDTPFAQVVQILTLNTVSDCWTWDDYKWLAFESNIMDPSLNVSDGYLARALGTTERTIRTLREWYGSVGNAGRAGRKQTIEGILIDNPTATSNELMKLLGAEGVTMTPRALACFKTRMRKSGQLPSLTTAHLASVGT